MIILVDQDQPLADLENYFIKVWREKYPQRDFVRFEKRRTADIEDDYPENFREDILAIRREPGFFLKLPPIEGMKQALLDMTTMGHKVFICTSPSRKSPHCLTEKYLWVQKHLGRKFTERLIITRDKTLVRGDVLIDDKPEIGGIAKPSWLHVLFDAPYNRNLKGRPRLKKWSDWQKVVK